MKHKVGIIGFQFANNYGALLQLYAQKMFIEAQGFEVDIINVKKTSRSKWLKWGFDFVFFFNFFYFRFFHLRCYLPAVHMRDYDPKSLEKYNVLIIGTDQLWRHDIVGDAAQLYFLQDVTGVRKMANSVSVGRLTEQTASFLLTHKDNLQDFEKITVREPGVLGLMPETFNTACVASDPVFLFSEIPEKGKKEAVSTSRSRAYVLLDKFNEQSLGRELQREGFIKANRGSVIKFLNNLSKYDLIVTDSYHTLCLALLKKVPCVCVSTGSRGNARYSNLEYFLDKPITILQPNQVLKACRPGSNEIIEISNDELDALVLSAENTMNEFLRN